MTNFRKSWKTTVFGGAILVAQAAKQVAPPEWIPVLDAAVGLFAGLGVLLAKDQAASHSVARGEQPMLPRALPATEIPGVGPTRPLRMSGFPIVKPPGTAKKP
jgi:hypothetical protein